MAAKRLSMRKTKEVLRLYFGLGLGARQVSRCLGISHSTVSGYIRRATEAGVGWPLPEELDEAGLERLLFPPQPCAGNSECPLPDFEHIHRGLKRKGVTLHLLWLEYKERHPEGYQYTQFCEHYGRWVKTLNVSMKQEHRAGEKMFVDFAGKGIPWIDASTGEEREARVFVATLGASSYTYAEAVETESITNWVGAHVRAFNYMGGVPGIVVPDNLKAGVSKACRYEPDINPTYRDMAEHYGTAVIPARVGKPRDKAKVEAAVQVVTRWITAVLRHRTFFSIGEINRAIRELLVVLNGRKFKKLNSSRGELYETLDRPALKPLPAQRYEYAEWKQATVNIDYHIEAGGHLYSVPYQLVKKKVEVRLTAGTVEVFYKGRRVAMHQRKHHRGFSTLNEHRPKAHQRHLEWTPSRIVSWAEKTGPATAELVQRMMDARPHPEQGFRSALGILRLGKKYSLERLEAASRRALNIRACSYRSVRSILETSLDRLPLDEQKEVMPTVEHGNIRGNHYYN